MGKKTKRKRQKVFCALSVADVAKALDKSVEELIKDREDGESRPIAGSDRICGIDKNGLMWNNLGKDPNLIRYDGMAIKTFQDGELINIDYEPLFFEPDEEDANEDKRSHNDGRREPATTFQKT